jgi:hypothetical protein
MIGPEPIIITFLMSLRLGIGFFSFSRRAGMLLFLLWRSFGQVAYMKKAELSNKKGLCLVSFKILICL